MGPYVLVGALAMLLAGAVASAAGLRGAPFAWAGLLLAVAGLIASRRALKLGSASRAMMLAAEIGVVLALLGAADTLLDRHRVRHDATRSRLFTLAEPTSKLLRSLDRDVTITDIHAAASPLRHQARDLLSSFRAESPRIKTQFIDPDLQPSLARNFRPGEGATIVQCGPIQKVVRHISERSLALAIHGATRADRPLVAVSEGHGEPAVQDKGPLGLTLLHDTLVRENLRVEAMSLTASRTAPAVLLVPYGRKDLTAGAAQAIRRLWAAGTSVLLLLEPGEDRPVTRELLADWGLMWQGARAEDLDSHLGGDPGTAVVSKYPPHPLTEGIAETLLPGVSPVGFASEEAAAWWKPILALSETSRATLASGAAGPAGRLIVAVASDRKGEAAHGRRAVVGDTDFLSNGALARYPVNAELAVSLVCWLAEREELLGVWPEPQHSFRLTLTDKHLRALAAVTLLGMPCLLLLVAFYRWMELRRG